MENKTTWMKIKDSLPTAMTSAVIVIILILVIFSLFKIVPAFITKGSSYFASALNSVFVPNEKIEEEKETPTTVATTTKTVVKVVPQYYGKSDLSIKLIGTGVVDKTTNQFYQTNYAGFNDTAGIKFQIENVGTNVSGTFMVRMNLPSKTMPYYDSVRQISLRPGDKIEYVASFDNPINLGINNAYITADPLNEVNEVSENNNSLTVPVKIDSSSYSYNNIYNYATTYDPNPVLPYGTLYSWVNMQGSCYATIKTTYPGNTITWYATATGGNGYFEYSWTGSDGLSSNMNYVDKTYYYPGPKTARVTITSAGQSITKDCSTYLY